MSKETTTPTAVLDTACPKAVRGEKHEIAIRGNLSPTQYYCPLCGADIETPTPVAAAAAPPAGTLPAT